MDRQIVKLMKLILDRILRKFLMKKKKHKLTTRNNFQTPYLFYCQRMESILDFKGSVGFDFWYLLISTLIYFFIFLHIYIYIYRVEFSGKKITSKSWTEFGLVVQNMQKY